MILVLPQCQKEILDFPSDVREELTDALAQLEAGQRLSMPLSRPMPSIGKGVHELRFRDRAGIYRVVYVFKGEGVITLIHAFVKKSQTTQKNNLELARKRLKET